MLDAPHSSEAERGLLGSIIVDSDRVLDVCARRGVTVDSFYLPTNRMLYRAILDLRAERGFAAGCIDILTLAVYLRTKELMARIGGDIAFEQLVDACPTANNAEYYADIVRDRELMRNAVTLARELVESAETSTDAKADIIALQDGLSRLEIPRIDETPIADVGLSVIDEWQHGEIPNGLTWPIAEMNRVLPQLTDEFVIIAAKPSVGKTALAVNFLVTNGIRQRSGIMASLESSKRQLVDRFIAHIASVNTLSLRTKASHPDKYDKARDAMRFLKTLPVEVSDTPMNDAQLSAWAKHLCDKGAQYVIVDNLRHVQTLDRFESMPVRFGEVSLRMKLLRDRLKKPVILLHHLNKEDGLAWSSDIEKDADVVLTMNRDDDQSVKATEGTDEKCVIRLEIQKYRNAPAPLTFFSEFVKKTQTFADMKGTA